MSSKLKHFPAFQSEEEERDFWRNHDSADYIDLSRLEPAVFPNLRPTTRTISIRLPEILLADIKMLANKRDVPYQSLMKIFLAEKVQETLKKS